MPWTAGNVELSAKLTISHLHQYHRPRELRPLTKPNCSMPRFDLTLPFNRLARIFASFSVRTRIVVLALIPVGGFLANGFTYTAGESEVGRAFRTVTHFQRRVRRQPRLQKRGRIDASYRKGFHCQPGRHADRKIRAASRTRAQRPRCSRRIYRPHSRRDHHQFAQRRPGIARKFQRFDSGAENTRL
jgi:hypothetical protein